MKLPEDFGKRAFEIFDNSEISEPLLMVYHHLEFIGLHRSGFVIDSFKISRSVYFYMFNGEEVLKQPVSTNGNFFDFQKKCFVMVFEHDSLVQELFQLHVADDDSLVVELASEDR